MLHQRKPRPLARTAVAGVFAFSAMTLTACSDDTAGPETGTDVEDIQQQAGEPYDGDYDSAFYEDIESYEGEEVTVSADVNEVITSSSFTIGGTDDTDVEPLLVVSAVEVSGLEPDLTVKVTGTVRRQFSLPAAEGEVDVELERQDFDDFDGEPYIVADSVDTSVASDQ